MNVWGIGLTEMEQLKEGNVELSNIMGPLQTYEHFRHVDRAISETIGNKYYG